MSDVPENEFR
jgi:hypothetical protein